MPPAEYGSSYDTAFSEPQPGEYIPRFSRDKLDPVGQKLYDQLKDQRDRIEKAQGADKARQLYSDLPGRPDETLALMAEELRSTGMTDIYKIKQDTQRIPVQEYWQEHSEGGNSTVSYSLPDGTYVDPSRVQRDDKGNVYTTKSIYTNTETGQPLATNAGLTPFSGRQDILSDYSVRKRRDVGTGVRFTDEGIPIYFAEGAATPSSWKSFTNQLREAAASPVGKIAMAALLGPYGAGLSTTTAAALAGGISGLSAEGDIGDALKGAALGYAGAEAFGALTGNPALDAGMGTYDVSGFSPPTGLDAGIGAYDVSGFQPSYELPSRIEQLTSTFEPSVEDLLDASNVTWDNYGDFSSFETPLSAETPSLPEFSPEDMVPPSALPQPEVQGDPTAGFGGMPKAPPMTPEEVAAAAAAQGIGDPALAAEMGTADLSWMDKVNPAQVAAIGTGTLPGTTFLDKAAYAIGAAGEKLADKLTTPAGLASAAYGIASLADLSKSGSGGGGGGGGGWSGVMPRYTLERSVIPSAFERKPYERTEIINPDGTKTYTPTPVMGRAFFTAPKYVPRATATTTGTTSESTMPNTQPQDEPSVVPAAQGGIMALNKGRYLRGRTDGMADKIPSNIDGVQPAALSHGEFVIPADVVSHLGNGNSEAGADVLYKMMDRVRKARTGNPKQGKQINPDKFVPGGIVALNAGGVTQSGTGVTGPVATSNSSQLSTWAAPTVTETLGKAEALATEEVKPYMGQLTATASPVQTKAFDVASKLFDPQKQLTYVDPNDPAKKSMPVLNTYMNPYLEGVQKPMMAALERDADIRQQAIQSQFARAGAFGGSRELLARMENERALAEQKERVLGKTQADAFTAGADLYGRERDRELRALDSMLRAGGTERDIESEAVKALRGEYEFQRTEPMRLLKDYIDMLKGMPIKTETSSAQLSDLQKLGLTLTEASKLFDLLGGGK